jgi:hypothetical protein
MEMNWYLEKRGIQCILDMGELTTIKKINDDNCD